MMQQDSPAAHKNYTLAFYIQKEIATYKLNSYILRTSFYKGYLRYPASTLKIYTGDILLSHCIYVICDICMILQIVYQ